MLSAGADVTTSMVSAIAHLPRRDRDRANETVLAHLAVGEPISTALAASNLFPPDQLRFLALAERSGHLDSLLRELADFTDDLLALRRVIQSGVALPAMNLVAAAFILPFPAYFMGGSLLNYLGSALGSLAVIALIVTAGIVGFLRAPGWLLDRVLRPLPIFGTTWRELDYWNLTRTLALLARTTLGVIPALRLAADTCRSPRLATALRTTADHAEQSGGQLSPLLRASGELPAEMIALWQTGEQSGRLDETFQRLAKLFAERARNRLTELANWTPRLVYFVVAGFMVYKILGGMSAYVGRLNAF